MNGIQHFFIWSPEEGETFKLQNGVLNFGLFTKLPLTVSSTSVFLHRAHGGAVRRRGHLSRPLGLTLAKPAPSAPLFCDFRQGPQVKRNKSFRGPNEKLQMN